MTSVITQRAVTAALLGLTVIGQSADARVRRRSPAPALSPAAWLIGPIVDGENASRGVPLHPTKSAGGGWYIDLPSAPGSVNYVTFHHGSLARARRIVMRYRIEANPGVRIEPTTGPGMPSIITLYFQRRGDDWSGWDEFETYRWYATFASQMPITPGEHVIVAPLTGNWTALQSSSARTHPAAFRAALDEADEVGFVLGGGTGYGHGVYATGRARITVTGFSVQ
ncbi:hypothetical protein [Sphingomonas sp. RB1R13]|uniref:hypothetical protein n=1 Tax=Sphingomonas sp. RB1R13 TaxID=3096159 RepID=UPI002FC8E834